MDVNNYKGSRMLIFVRELSVRSAFAVLNKEVILTPKSQKTILTAGNFLAAKFYA